MKPKVDVSAGVLRFPNTVSCSFSTGTAIVNRFADITGDRSPIHIDSVFARHSIYRDNVVHGFLPVVCLGAVPGLPWTTHSISEISAVFSKPLFIGESFRLEVDLSQLSDASIVNPVTAFVVVEMNRQARLTTGTITWSRRNQALTNRTVADQTGGRPICEPMRPAELDWQCVSQGAAHQLPVFAGLPAVRSLEELCRDMAIVGGAVASRGWMGREELTASASLTTLVGMCMPGKFATFTDFRLKFNALIPSGGEMLLKSEVEFKSESTRTLVQSIRLNAGKDQKPIAEGKLNVKVNPAPTTALSLADLKDQAGNLNLCDKVVFITGSSRGVGEVTAKLFGIHGAKVVVHYYKGEADARRIAREIEADGGRASVVGGDVSDPASVNAMFDAIHNKYGGLDVLVNNAVRDAQPISFEDLVWDDVQQDLDVTVKGAFLCCKRALRVMAAKRQGKIINMSTVYADIPPTHQLKYVVSKNALIGLTRSLAVEYAPANIQVNLVAPGMMETDLSAGVSPWHKEQARRSSPMGRMPTPVDTAKTILFLASTFSDYITGQQIRVTGGSPPFL